MKGKFLFASVLTGAALVALAATDPVLMTINGKDIRLSEFEYHYHKNDQQPVEKETKEQYLERFITYKQKVADAEAVRIDTLPGFIKEFDGYKRDIVKPFLQDTTVRDRLVNEAYSCMKRNVDVDHFMYPLGANYAEQKHNRAFVDSLRTCLVNGQDWEAIVEKYSIDPSRVNNKGHYGFIKAGTFPYSFEKAAFSTPVGQVSDIIRTNYGFHLVRVNGERPDPGMVNARHILVLFPRNLTDGAKERVKERIDSLYQVVTTPGADFAEIAKKHSEDQRSAVNGGDLGWFGQGRMVPEFEKVCYELADGEISKPFETNYGYHIVQKIAHRGTQPLEDVRKNIEAVMMRDERGKMPQQAIAQKMKAQYNYKENKNLDKYLKNLLKASGGYDSAFIAAVKNSNEPLFTFAKKQTVPVSALAPKLQKKTVMNEQDGFEYVKTLIPDLADAKIMEYYTNNLIEDNADYRNLLNEYRDGMLLFERSNQRVWKAATKDTTGLRNYFENHRDHFSWNTPHFKGIILSAKDADIMRQVKDDIKVLGTDTLTTALHKKYGKDIKMERMLFAQGENGVVDYLLFNGPKPESMAEYPEAIVLEGGLIDAPQSVADVKGQVTSEYQDELERLWIQELKVKYPAKVNQNVFKKVK